MKDTHAPPRQTNGKCNSMSESGREKKQLNLTSGPYKYFSIEKMFELALKDGLGERGGQ